MEKAKLRYHQTKITSDIHHLNISKAVGAGFILYGRSLCFALIV
jgi:hypothetical protein